MMFSKTKYSVIILFLFARSLDALSLIETEFFIMDGMGCKYFKSPSYKIYCFDMDSPEYPGKIDLRKNDFIAKYPDLHEFKESRESKEIIKGRLKWTQTGFYYKLEARGKELTLNGEQFHSLYSNSTYLQKKGAIKNWAKCRPLDEGLKFECLMPWGGKVIYSTEEFVDRMAYLVRNKWSPRLRCFTREVQVIIDKHHALWRCWNGYFWSYDEDNGDKRRIALQQDAFSRLHGDLDTLLKNQPDQDLSQCSHLVEESQKLNQNVYKCDSHKEKFFFWPEYIEKPSHVERHHSFRSQKTNHKYKFRYAVMDSNSHVKFYFEDEFKDVLQGGGDI